MKLEELTRHAIDPVAIHGITRAERTRGDRGTGTSPNHREVGDGHRREHRSILKL